MPLEDGVISPGDSLDWYWLVVILVEYDLASRIDQFAGALGVPRWKLGEINRDDKTKGTESYRLVRNVLFAWNEGKDRSKNENKNCTVLNLANILTEMRLDSAAEKILDGWDLKRQAMVGQNEILYEDHNPNGTETIERLSGSAEENLKYLVKNMRLNWNLLNRLETLGLISEKESSYLDGVKDGVVVQEFFKLLLKKEKLHFEKFEAELRKCKNLTQTPSVLLRLKDVDEKFEEYKDQ